MRMRTGARPGVALQAGLGLVLLAGLLAPAPARATDGPVRILLVGDSITEGASGDWTWRYRLAAYLDAAGVDYDLVGPHAGLYDPVTGEHTDQDYADPAFDRDHDARWGQMLRLALDAHAPVPEDSVGWAVATYQPDVVVELLGVNDLLYGASPQDTLELASQLVQDVRDAKPDTRLVLSTVPAEQYAGVAEYNALLAATAPSWSTDLSPVVVSDPAPGWDPDVDTCDHTHPSAVGEVRIAAAQADALAGWGIGVPAARPLPEPPVGPRLPAVLDATAGDGEATLSWTLPPGGTAVQVSVRDVTAGSDWQALPIPLAGTSWVAGGLADGHTYGFRLQVLEHDCLAADVLSNEVEVTPSAAAPGAVSGLAVAPRDHGATATWAATPGVTSYAVWVRPSGGASAWQTQAAASTSAEVTGLEAGRSYDVAVQALAGGTAGPVGEPVTVVPDGVAPAPPPWAAGRATPDGSATLTWLAAEHATGYRLQHREARSGAAWVDDPVPAGSTTAVVSGLGDGRRYAFRVRGEDDLVPGAWSERLVVTVPVVGPVRDVRARPRDHGRLLRTRGDDVPWATGYRLLLADSRRCDTSPRPGRFALAATGTEPRLAVVLDGGAGATWVRWRAEHDGVPGRLARSSTTCVAR